MTATARRRRIPMREAVNVHSRWRRRTDGIVVRIVNSYRHEKRVLVRDEGNLDRKPWILGWTELSSDYDLLIEVGTGR